METGYIYEIRNQHDGHVYVGSAINPPQRWMNHITRLRANNHHSVRLQRAWIRDGEGAFLFKIIEVVNASTKSKLRKHMISREQHWIGALGAYGLIGYNMSPTASSTLGTIRSTEYRKKISALRTGMKLKPHSEETKRKIAAAHLGKPRGPMSAAHRAAIAAANRGKVRSAEFKTKLSAAHTGRTRGPMSEEHKQAIREAQLAKHMTRTPEQRAHLSAITKARWAAGDPTIGKKRRPELF